MKKNYDIFDITKLILSLMVVAIHSSIFPMILYPWLRLAVPLFFIISSFLLFDRIKSLSDIKKNEAIKKYIIRLIKLYLFWLIVLLPVTILKNKNIFENGIIIGFLKIIKKFFFESTFSGSWFITATIIGTLLVYFLSKKINYKFLFSIFVILYIFCCISSSYNVIFEKNQIISNLYNMYVYILGKPEFNFTVSLLYILIGKLYAEGKIKKIKKRYAISIFIVSFVALYIEWRSIYRINGYFNKDCYLFLPLVSFSIFGLIKNLDISVTNAKIYRKFSTFIYPLHITLIGIIKVILNAKINITNTYTSIIAFIVTLFATIIMFYIILKLENKKYFKFLRYSH